MHHCLYQVRSNSLLKGESSREEAFFCTGAAVSSFHKARPIQDDTDLDRAGITIDHASETLQYGQCASVQAEKARSSRDVYLGCDTL
jgi:hypothetical protein